MAVSVQMFGSNQIPDNLLLLFFSYKMQLTADKLTIKLVLRIVL